MELVWELKGWPRLVYKNLGSVASLCLFFVIYLLETLVSVLFSNIATRTHIASAFAELLEKIDPRTNKRLEDSSNMVKSGYAAMIKLKNELSKQGQCLFDWSRL